MAGQLFPAVGLADSTALATSAGTAFVARWEIDLAEVEDLISAMDGREPPRSDWVEALLYGARIVDLNERAALVVGTGSGREQMLGQPVASFAPPDSWEALAGLIVAVALDRPGHSVRSSPLNSFMLDEADLKVWGLEGEGQSRRLFVAVEGTISDDRSPWAVRASEARYRRLFHHLPGALLQADARMLNNAFHELRASGITDIDAYIDEHPEFMDAARDMVRITDANDGAARLFEAGDPAALAGPVHFLFAAAPDTAKRVVSARFDGKRTHSELMKVRTLDGRLVDVQISVTYPAPPERLDVTLISLEDVSDRLATEAQLRQVQADYGRAARIATLGELASSIAHEVNQPLSAISMNADTALRWLCRDEPNLAKAMELLARISDSAGNASDIVQRIRGMAGRHVPERTLVRLEEVVEESLPFVRHDLETRSIGLSLHLPAGIPPLLADRVQLQQVIVNLLVNAIQAVGPYRPSGGRIALRSEADGEGNVTFEIRDNGPGVAEADIGCIFDGFFTTKEDGMGIGLAVCQSIIVAHGGKITVANHPGGGAIFRFTLPPGPALGRE